MMFIITLDRLYDIFLLFFFFQAEDGIRDYKVTGVQTCALPICDRIGDSARRQAAWNRHRLRTCVEYYGRATHVSPDELRRACAVVGDPEGAAGSRSDAPRIDEERVEHWREPWNVRKQIRLSVRRS